MIYLKSLLVGLVAAVIVSVLWFLTEIGVMNIMMARQMGAETANGSGGIGAVSMPLTFPVGAVLGFAI
jgi:hypothetical protein